MRLASLSLFDNLPSSARVSGGIASGNPLIVRSLSSVIAGHLAHYLVPLRERYLQR